MGEAGAEAKHGRAGVSSMGSEGGEREREWVGRARRAGSVLGVVVVVVVVVVGVGRVDG